MVKDETFREHKLLLSVRSPVFSAMFNQPTTENAEKLLQEECEQFLIKTISIQNCIDYLWLADRHYADKLKRKAVEFMRNFSTDVLATESWKEKKRTQPVFCCSVLELLHQPAIEANTV